MSVPTSIVWLWGCNHVNDVLDNMPWQWILLPWESHDETGLFQHAPSCHRERERECVCATVHVFRPCLQQAEWLRIDKEIFEKQSWCHIHREACKVLYFAGLLKPQWRYDDGFHALWASQSRGYAKLTELKTTHLQEIVRSVMCTCWEGPPQHRVLLHLHHRSHFHVRFAHFLRHGALQPPQCD